MQNARIPSTEISVLKKEIFRSGGVNENWAGGDFENAHFD
jgi:hypothetical protein